MKKVLILFTSRTVHDITCFRIVYEISGMNNFPNSSNRFSLANYNIVRIALNSMAC